MQDDSSKRVMLVDEQDDTRSSSHSKRARSEGEGESDNNDAVIIDEEAQETEETTNLDDFIAIRAITDEQMYKLFPEFEEARKITSEEYRYPTISEQTAKYLKRMQVRFRPANGKTLENLQRASVHLFNKSAEQSEYNKKKAHRILQPVVNGIDQTFRHMYLPLSSEKNVFNPDLPALRERNKKQHQKQFTKLVDVIEDYLPIKAELEQYEIEGNQLEQETEGVKEVLRNHPSYVPPKVDSKDYSQSLFLFNSSTLLS